MKLLQYITTGIAAIMAVILVIGLFQMRATQDELAYWRNEAHSTADLYHVADSIAARRAQEVDNLKSDKAELNQALSASKETIRSLTSINGELETALANAETTVDTLWLPDSVAEEIRRFEESPEPFYLKGYFKIKNPYTITFEKITAQVQLELALTEDKYGAWRAYATSTNPNFTVTGLEPAVNPYTPGFWEQLKFGAGIYGGSERLGIMSSVYYKSHAIRLMFDTQGAGIGYEKTFSINR